MLFGIYLGTTIYTWRSLFKYLGKLKERLDEEGYEVIDSETDKKKLLLSCIAISFPVLNLVFPFLFSNFEFTYEKMKQSLLDKGVIRAKNNGLTKEATVKTEEIKQPEYSENETVTRDLFDETLTAEEIEALREKLELIRVNGENQDKIDKAIKKINKALNKTAKANEKVNKQLQRNLNERPLYPLMEQHYVPHDAEIVLVKVKRK